MKFLRLTILGLGLSLFIAAGHASAYANTPPLDPAYNSRIIDDPIFLNKNSMSVQDIQNFLNSKVPTCDTNHQGGLAQYPPPYVCLKDYVDPTTNKKASQLIYDEAQAAGLNPQVILVTLEKEQGLVTDSWPYPSQYRSAMGYGCPESQSICDAQYYGFYNQVHLGASLLRAGAARACGDTSTLSNWNDIPDELKLGHTTDPNGPAHRVDSVATYIGSCATGSLYNYTPHRPDSAYTARNGAYYYGNYNFINYFTNWFGPTTITLAKSASAPQIYLNLGTRKLLVPSYDVMAAWNLSAKPVSIVDQSYLDSLTSDGTLSTLAKKDNGAPTIYMADNGHQFSVPSGQACTDWALACGDTNVVKTLPAAMIEALGYYGDLPFMTDSSGTVYRPVGGQKRPIVDMKTLNNLGGWSKVMSMQAINMSQPLGPVILSNDTMVKFGGNPGIYLYDQDALHLFSSPDLLAAWNYGAEGILNVPAGYDTGLTIGAPATALIRDSGNTTWLLDRGSRYSLTGREADWPVQTAVTFGQGVLSRLPALGLATILHAPTGDIFTVTGGQHYIFPSFDDFFGLGNTVSAIGDVSTLTESLTPYGGSHLAPGRVFKVAGSDAIYVNNGAARVQVPALSYLGSYQLPAGKAITVDSQTAARYPLTGSLQPIFKDSSGKVYVANGQRQYISPSIITAAGLDTSATPTLVDPIVNRMPSGQNVTQFIKGSDGAIYYLNGGQRHYVDTQAKLNSLGGSNNVVSVSDSFIQAITLGAGA